MGEENRLPSGKCGHVFKTISMLCATALILFSAHAASDEVFSAGDVFKTKRCSSMDLCPDGNWIAYTVSVMRKPNDEPGGAYSELYVVSTQTAEIRPFITGKVNVSSPKWNPDGKWIAFKTKRGKDAKTQVWVIPAFGGESAQVTHSKTGVSAYRWHPSGKRILYTATAPRTDREKELEKKGYKFIYYEEDLKHRNLYMVDIQGEGVAGKAKQITRDVTVWNFEVGPDGKTVAAAISKMNQVDHQYMFSRIHLLDLESGKLTRLTDNPGKLGNFSFSPDGKKIAYTAALERRDHAVSQVYVMDINGKNLKNLTEPGFRGHVNWVGWKDDATILYRAGEGVWPTLSLVPAGGGKREVILHSRRIGIPFNTPDYTRDFEHFALIGNTPEVPGDVYYWKPGQQMKRLTTINPWIAERKLGEQKVIQYKARDGQVIEGLLIHPVDYRKGERCPLIVVVHGGPESHYSNGWFTRYSSPAQVYAGKGYAVFFPNYRASTGYGVDFALEGYGDAGGKEFDDVADGITFLINERIADPERVGLGGGSYGGYAAAWFSSYYTKYVRAVCMFVGISNLISKRSTTDIPYEEMYVHSGKPLEEMWQANLERSPVYWAHQSKTATLILGGANDTRVHPSQSLEFYRRLKMNGHPAIRLVQYPGEGHGNRKQPGKIDLLHRQIQWYDWYVRDRKPLDGPMPPLDISDLYGLEFPDQ